jgi:hypothetical protein
MAGKLVESAHVKTHEVGIFVEPEQVRTDTEIRPLRVALSGTVVVEFEVTVLDGERIAGRAVVQVEFPDDVRSMLEASTWTRGTSIHEVLSRLGAAFLKRNGITELVRTVANEATRRRPTTFHLPLSYVRSSLASVCATSS